MIRAYEYAFYWFYTWQMHVRPSSALVSALILLSVVVFYNALALLAFAEGLAGRTVIPGGPTKPQFVLAGAVIFALQYFALVYTGRYHTISERYHSESAHQRRVRGTIVVSYAVLSFILMICASIFRGGTVHA